MEFDTDKEEREGAWVVLAMFAVVAAVPPLASLWMMGELDQAATSSPVRIGPLVGGLTVAGLAGMGLSVVGAGLVLYGLVRVKMHGPMYVLGGVLTTVAALSPVLLGWNRVDEIPAVEDFDPGDCSSCGDEIECEHRWPALGAKVTARGACHSGRRDGQWVFETRRRPEMATFRFENGLRHGRFETDRVRGSFRDDVRDGEWAWLRSGAVVSRGRYVGGVADGRWVCLDEDSGDELTWVVFERGRVVEATGDVYRGSDVVAAGDAVEDLELEGMSCGPAPLVDPFERMVLAEPRAR